MGLVFINNRVYSYEPELELYLSTYKYDKITKQCIQDNEENVKITCWYPSICFNNETQKSIFNRITKIISTSALVVLEATGSTNVQQFLFFCCFRFD